MQKFVVVNLKSHNVHVVNSTDAKLSNPDYYTMYKGTDDFDVGNFAHTMKMAYLYTTKDRSVKTTRQN